MSDVSSVSSYFAQIDAMQWTPYMEECLEVLSQNRDCPYDEMFAHQVLLQRTAGELENARGTTTVPSSFYVAALRLKMDEIKANISPQLQQDGEFSRPHMYLLKGEKEKFMARPLRIKQ